MPSFHPCCLIAEDQALIGMALEAYLDEVGMAVAGPFASGEDALAWAEHATPDVALLDFKLKDGICIELVRALLKRDVPVVIYSGLPRGANVPPDLEGITWIEKPLDRDRLLDLLVSLTAPGCAQG